MANTQLSRLNRRLTNAFSNVRKDNNTLRKEISVLRRESNEKFINREDYVKLFDSCGEVIFISDYSGKIIRGQRDTEKAGKVLPKKGIIISTRKT